MSRKCDLCGKHSLTGFNVSHSKRHTKRKWLPNVHSAKLVINGEQKKFKLCTRCLRTYNKTASA